VDPPTRLEGPSGRGGLVVAAPGVGGVDGPGGTGGVFDAAGVGTAPAEVVVGQHGEPVVVGEVVDGDGERCLIVRLSQYTI
jgi:hypothetical protein